MNNRRTASKLALITSVVTLSAVTIALLSYLWLGNTLVASAYRGESIGPLNSLIAHLRRNHPAATLEDYVIVGRRLFSRLLLVCMGLQATFVASLMYRRVLGVLKEFFAARTHPLNLAVFRVVLFYTIYSSVSVDDVVWFSQVPAELRVAPIGVGWLLDLLPTGPTWARVSAMLFLVCSLTAMIGLLSRTSALLTVVLGVYVLGIPQFYGKVNHYHHLLWFAALLAPSRCGDAFSCDALIAAWRRADHGVVDPPDASSAYALPLRFVWLLIGVIYFFAGGWKAWAGGIDWALSDNLRLIMYQKWTDLGGWTPSFRIDQHAVLYRLAAFGTIGFEMSFVFLLFSRRLRLVAVGGGLLFHKMIEVFMRISFASLVRCYVVFFDWNAIFRRIGRWLYRERMYVLYDGHSRACRRTIACLQVFDQLGRVTYLAADDQAGIKDHELHCLHPVGLAGDLHVIVRRTVRKGLPAYRAVALRIPVLWPAVPFLYLWLVPTIANRVLRSLAASPTGCASPVVSTGYVQSEKDWPGMQLSRRAVIAVGALLLVGNVCAGVGRVVGGWPLACYPTFAVIKERPETSLPEILILTTAGATIPLTSQNLGHQLASTRFLGLIRQALWARDEAQRRARMKALWRLWVRNDPRLRQAGSIRVYRLTLSTVPEQWQRNPLRRELLLEVAL